MSVTEFKLRAEFEEDVKKFIDLLKSEDISYNLIDIIIERS